MQRETIDPTQQSDEILAFSPLEADIAARAILCHMRVNGQWSEQGLRQQSLIALGAQSVSEIHDRIQRTATSVARYANLAAKMDTAGSNPEEPVTLSVNEIFLLGNALCTVGLNGARQAGLSLENDERRLGQAARAVVSGRVDENVAGAKKLYDEVSVIAYAKELQHVYPWPIWESEHPAATNS